MVTGLHNLISHTWVGEFSVSRAFLPRWIESCDIPSDAGNRAENWADGSFIEGADGNDNIDRFSRIRPETKQ